MTPHPEAAMTREQVLEEAWRKRCNDPTLRNDRASFLIFQAGFEAALASTRQEPAPAADAEDVALNLLAWANALRSESNSAMSIGEIALVNGRCITDDLETAAAALRRYASDGVVTDEQVEAAAKALCRLKIEQNATRWNGKPYPEEQTLASIERAWHDYIEESRRALEAAARAKSGEKGGAR